MDQLLGEKNVNKSIMLKNSIADEQTATGEITRLNRLFHQQPGLSQKQIGHASVKTTLNVYGQLLKEMHERAQKLDVIHGFAEQFGSSSDGPAINEKGVAEYLQPIELIGSNGRNC